MSAETSIIANIDELEILPVFATLEDAERRQLAEDHSIASTRILSYIKGVVINPNTIFDDVDLAVGDVLLGSGQDWQLQVTETFVLSKHTLADETEVGSPGTYTGDLRTGMILTGSGLAFGYNDKTTGNWVNAIAINATGDITMLGTLSAGSIIVGSVTIGGGNSLTTVDANATAGNDHSLVSGTNPHNVSLGVITGDLDDIADGSTYFRSTASQNTGGTRAVSALDSANDYTRSLTSTKIVVSGSNPANGIVIDNSGIRGYSAGSLKFEINTSGTSTWGGAIITSGQVKATGSTSGTGGTGAIVGQSTSSVIYGILGSNTSTLWGILGYGNYGGVFGWAYGNHAASTGVAALCTYSAGRGLSVTNSGGGPAIAMGSPIIEGDADFEDDVEIQGTLTMSGGNLNLTGGNDLTVDKNIFAGTDGSSGDSSIVIGGTGKTGKNTLVIYEGTEGSRINGQLHIGGYNLSGTVLAIVAEKAVQAVSSWSHSTSIPIRYNGTTFYISVSTVA